MPERRRTSRRHRMVRNIFSYLNRRVLERKGRRENEEDYDQVEDWFEREQRPPKKDADDDE